MELIFKSEILHTSTDFIGERLVIIFPGMKKMNLLGLGLPDNLRGATDQDVIAFVRMKPSHRCNQERVWRQAKLPAKLPAPQLRYTVIFFEIKPIKDDPDQFRRKRRHQSSPINRANEARLIGRRS